MALAWIARRVWRGFREDDCGFLAAALAYQLFFALIPFLLLVAGVLGLFLENDALRLEVGALIRQIAPSADRTFVDEIVAGGPVSFGIGLLGTLWSVTAIHASLDRALRIVLGGDQRPFLTGRLKGLAFALLLAALALVSFVLSFAVQALASWLTTIGATAQRDLLLLLSPVAGLVAGFAFFAIVYAAVPRRRLSTPAILAGAAAAALLWEAAKIAFALLAREAGLFRAYGVLALAAGLLTWVYLTALILLLGAEVMKAWSERRG